MKKIYQNPEITVVKMQPSLMIVTSNTNPKGFTGSLGDDEDGGSGEEGLSKSGGFWSDDEY